MYVLTKHLLVIVITVSVISDKRTILSGRIRTFMISRIDFQVDSDTRNYVY